MNTQTLPSPVVASLVSDAERSLVLPRHFGSQLLEAETTIFAWLRELSADYQGGLLALLRTLERRVLHGARHGGEASDRGGR